MEHVRLEMTMKRGMNSRVKEAHFCDRKGVLEAEERQICESRM